MQPADGYVRKGRKRVPGWFELEDAILFQVFNQMQVRAGVRGDLLEIGAYHGKSAILMGFLARPGETLTVCDLFGRETGSEANARENKDYYPRLQERKFLKNYLRYHPGCPQILKESSLQIEPLLEGRHFRFIHIDGSHLYSIVRHDIDLARRFASPDAVIALDDIASAHTPGVTAAAWEAVTQTQLLPLCVTKKKLYATSPPEGVLNRNALRRALTQTRLTMLEFDCVGGPLLRVLPGREAPRVARALAPLRPPILDFLSARLQSLR